MGEPRGFLSYPRSELKKEHPSDRTKHFREFVDPWENGTLREQGARCMDCGVPFCHRGCPLGNNIPEWNDLTSKNEFRQALQSLLATNNFPEFTGRICPAPCEASCVLGINEDPVSIESIEMSLAEKGFKEGWIVPQPPAQRSEQRIAVIGSGPTGLAAAQQLNRAGYSVVVFERSQRPGGLLMYGIPDFKLEKATVERRLKLLEEEGIVFRCGVHVGVDVTLQQLRTDFDAVLLACGAPQARDLNIPGRSSKDVWLAMDFLTDSNQRIKGKSAQISATPPAYNKDVVVIGGGDTGSDCIGTARRQGARNIIQFELMPMPPDLPRFPRHDQRSKETPWPEWPYMLRTSSSHEEGCQREFALESVRFELDSFGGLKSLVTQSVQQVKDADGRAWLQARPETERHWPCQLALIAIGFTGADANSFLDDGGIELTSTRKVLASEKDFMTNLSGVFAAGDLRRGPSLVVWAIAEGRKVAQAIDSHLRHLSESKRPSSSPSREIGHDQFPSAESSAGMEHHSCASGQTAEPS